MSQDRVLELLEELLNTLGGANVPSFPPSHRQTLALNVNMLKTHIAKPTAQRTVSVLRSCWRTLLRNKHDSDLEPWLRKHGKFIVEFLIKEGH